MQGALIFSFLIVLPSIFFITNAQVHDARSPASPGEQIYIVYLYNGIPKGQGRESYYTKILNSVVGSEEAAKHALLYSYNLIPGFAARLNPDQATSLKKKEGVDDVIRDIRYTLDDGINGQAH